jgi:flagellar basal-body rod protein FlgF
MLRGLYTAGAGMITETLRTDTIANNLANVDTTGYKKDTMVSEEFAPMLLRRINDTSKGTDVTSFKGFSAGAQAPIVGPLGRGSLVSEIATNFEQGAFKTTGNTLDMAISGRGYFVINTPQGQRYTRNGSFSRSTTGQLVTSDGNAVLDTNGRPITLPGNGTVTVSADGQIYDGPDQIAQLQLVDFADRRALLKQGSSLFYPQAGAQPQPATGSVQQGLLESSNVNTVSEMVKLISNYRTYEADSKALTTQDSLLEKAVNEVGKV